MQIALHAGRQGVEPARGTAGGEGGFETRGVGGVVHDVAEEGARGGSFERGEDGGGGEGGGELGGEGAEAEEDGGVCGEGEGGEGGARGGGLVGGKGKGRGALTG